jgi:hypothetical protein
MLLLAGWFLFGHAPASGQSFGVGLDDTEQQAMTETFQYALSNNADRQESTWINPETGRSGAVVPLSAYVNQDGLYCREYVASLLIDGQEERAYGTACRYANGIWVLQAGAAGGYGPGEYPTAVHLYRDPYSGDYPWVYHAPAYYPYPIFFSFVFVRHSGHFHHAHFHDGHRHFQGVHGYGHQHFKGVKGGNLRSDRHFQDRPQRREGVALDRVRGGNVRALSPGGNLRDNRNVRFDQGRRQEGEVREQRQPWRERDFRGTVNTGGASRQFQGDRNFRRDQSFGGGREVRSERNVSRGQDFRGDRGGSAGRSQGLNRGGGSGSRGGSGRR